MASPRLPLPSLLRSPTASPRLPLLSSPRSPTVSPRLLPRSPTPPCLPSQSSLVLPPLALPASALSLPVSSPSSPSCKRDELHSARAMNMGHGCFDDHIMKAVVEDDTISLQRSLMTACIYDIMYIAKA